MLFRLESTDHLNPIPAQTPEDLQSRLQGALKTWLETTPQHTDTEAEAAFAKVAAARQSGARAEELPKLVGAAVDAWKGTVKAHSATLDDVHTEVVQVATAAIAGAVAQAKALGLPVRVSIVGHVDPVAPDGIYVRPRIRCNTELDLAKH